MDQDEENIPRFMRSTRSKKSVSGKNDTEKEPLT
jgi:hypothetical protein